MATEFESESPIFELMIVFVVVQVAQLLASAVGLMSGLFVLSPPLAVEPWTIVTSVYAHSGVGHLLSNTVALIVFGWPIARATSRLRFHLFFLITGAIAGVSQIVVTTGLAAAPVISVTPTGGVLGASGAVFALLGYLLAGNRLSGGFASVIDVPAWVTYLVFFALAVVVTLATFAPGVALIAHFTGLLLGLLAGRARVLQTGSQTRGDRSAV